MSKEKQKSLRRGHKEGNIRQRSDGRWEVRLSAGIDFKTGKPKRTSTCCATKQEAIAILQEQAHEVRTNGWKDPMGVTLAEWYQHWLETKVRDSVKQSTYISYEIYDFKKKRFQILFLNPQPVAGSGWVHFGMLAGKRMVFRSGAGHCVSAAPTKDFTAQRVEMDVFLDADFPGL